MTCTRSLSPPPWINLAWSQHQISPIAAAPCPCSQPLGAAGVSCGEKWIKTEHLRLHPTIPGPWEQHMKAIPHFGNAPPHFRADKVLQVTLKERSTVREQKLLQIVGSFQGNLFFGDMDMSILIWADFPGVVPVGLGAPWTSDTPKKKGQWVLGKSLGSKRGSSPGAGSMGSRETQRRCWTRSQDPWGLAREMFPPQLEQDPLLSVL